MRTYGQYCALAKALDVVGERWSLLIVRELLLGGPSRYTDLSVGLPGIASNLLTERLRQLEEAGVVRRDVAPPPIATTLYSLTPRGEALRAVVKELGHWGGSLLPLAPDDDAFRGYWLTFPAEELLTDNEPEAAAVVVQLQADGQRPVLLEVRGGNVRAIRESDARPDLMISGPHRVVVRFISGLLGEEGAVASGLSIGGDRAVLRRVIRLTPAAPGQSRGPVAAPGGNASS